MKKLTKKEKENLRKKTFKVLNIVSYILSGIFIVFLIISFVQSCSSKNELSNDLTQTTETRQVQRLQEGTQDYMYPVGTLGNADIDNPFPLDGNSSAYVITDFNRNMYAVSGITFVDYLTNITENNTKVYNFPSGVYFSFSVQLCINLGGGSITFDDNIISQPTGFIYSIEYFDADTEGGNLIYIYRFITSNGTFDIGFYYTDQNSLGASMYITCMFTTLRNNCEMPKFLIDTCTYMYPKINDNYTTLKDYILNNDEFSTKYELPPYLRINSDVKGFSVDIGCNLQLNGNNVDIFRFTKIEYAYHDSLYFVSESGLPFKWQLLTIDSEGNYYFSYRNKLYSSIDWGSLGNPYMYEEYTSIPKIVFTSFGTNGYDFIDEYFINPSNNYIGGDYFLDINYIYNVIYSGRISEGYHTYELTYRFNEVFYQSITIYVSVQEYTNSFFYVYFNLGTSFYSPTSKFVIGLTPTGNQNMYQISSELIDLNTENYMQNTIIHVDDNILTLDKYNLIGTYFVPYLNDNYFDIGIVDNDNIALGNVFTLLGGAFGGIASLMSITIIPGITLGILLFIPLIILIILFIVHLFKR